MFANFLYLVALTAVSPLILYRMIRYGRYRRGVAEKLWGLSAARARILRGADQPGNCLWIHAVSVGEVNLLPGVVQQIHARDPSTRVVVSTSTDTGYDVALKHFGSDTVFFCPLDFSWAVKRTLRNLAPDQLILAELELWPNLVRIADSVGCPVSVINARLSANSAAGYLRFYRLTEPIFRRLSWVGCQDELAAQRFQACGTAKNNIVVTGSLKFDNAPDSRDTAEVQSRAEWAGVDPWHSVWLVGSTQAGEERMALEIYRSLQQQHPELRLILVPRHPERFRSVAELIRYSGLRAHRRSLDGSLVDSQWNNDTVILIDTIGELRHWWGVCQIATVGGSFGDRGGQNMLEPAGYGCAVSFGPNTKNFADIADRLIMGEGAIRIKDETELKEFVSRCLSDVPAADALGRAARAVVNEHCGATERTVRGLMHVQTPAETTIRRAA
jgi:3-deoxy-D-manno-octulosonic-acid transferase